MDSPGNWSNSFAFRALHTQSPYDTSFNDPSLIGGGVDDRFDFQLVSGEVLDNEGFSHILATYRGFGNNGSHSLNDAINDPSNTAASPGGARRAGQCLGPLAGGRRLSPAGDSAAGGSRNSEPRDFGFKRQL